MTLATEVTTRYSDKFVRQLTNPDNAPQGSVDAARLALAVTDATAEFERLAASPFDLTNPHHVDVAVQGVILKLMERGGTHPAGDSAETIRGKFEKQCAALGSTQGGRTRVQPSTNSILTPSSEGDTGTIVRPEFDRKEFNGLIPGPPLGPPLQ